MARKNPLSMVAGAAFNSIRHPLSTTGKLVGTVGKTAASIATGTAGAVVDRAMPAQEKPSPPAHRLPVEPPTQLRAVPEVNEPGHPPAQSRRPEKSDTSAAARARPAERRTEPARPHGDPLADQAPPTARKAPAARKQAEAQEAAEAIKADTEDTAPAKKSRTQKSTARKKSSAKKSTARRKSATAKKSTAGKKAAAKTNGTKKTAATPADVAEVVEAAVAEDPSKTAARQATTRKSTGGSAKKGRPAKKAASGDKLPSAPAEPRTSGSEPVGEEPLFSDPDVKAVASEAETLRKAAEKQPE